MTISHISDTARWVATYRARESARPDAIFRDPYARRLAGEEGERIVSSMQRGEAMSWAFVVRTAIFDELLLAAIARDQIDVVINLAAGLDARPWRLTLPSELRWVDVDLPEILAYKREVLGGETPRCHYEAVATDLRDEAARRALFARLASNARGVIVLAEGLLIYLKEEDVMSLARDLRAIPNIRGWIIDLLSPQLLQFMQRGWGRAVARADAPFLFAPAAGTDFFAAAGWGAGEYRESHEEAKRLNRTMQVSWIGRAIGWLLWGRRMRGRMSGIVRLDPA